MNVRDLLLNHPRLLAFGVVLTGLSSFGQTFLISLFGGHVREALELGNTGYGLIYSLATLASAVTLVRAGRVVDTRDLRLVTAGVLATAAAGCALLAGAHGVLVLLVAFYLLRLSGQGMMVHVAQTTMGRYFRAERGRAVSIAMLGLPLAEALMPMTLVAATGLLGWRTTWLAAAVVLAVAMVPLALWLLRGHSERVATWQAEVDATASDEARDGTDWRRRDVLRHPVFYALMPAIMGPPLIVTALFFHQVPVAEAKGWGLDWLASSFLAFGAAHVVGLVLAGPLVDRLGARRLVPLLLVPMLLALLTLALVPGAWAAPVYLFLMGMSAGTAGTLMGALWAELYGTRHLGAIRALAQAVMIMTTAVSPVLAGALLDGGMAPTTLALVLAGYTLAAFLLAATAGQR